MYDDLTRHWRRIVKHNLLEVQYESMVGDFNATARKILEFVGLPWNDNIHKAPLTLLFFSFPLSLSLWLIGVMNGRSLQARNGRYRQHRLQPCESRSSRQAWASGGGLRRSWPRCDRTWLGWSMSMRASCWLRITEPHPSKTASCDCKRKSVNHPLLFNCLLACFICWRHRAARQLHPPPSFPPPPRH